MALRTRVKTMQRNMHGIFLIYEFIFSEKNKLKDTFRNLIDIYYYCQKVIYNIMMI